MRTATELGRPIGGEQPPSRPINLHLRPKKAMAPAVYDRLDGIQIEVEAQGGRRRRDSAASNRFRSSLRALCLDVDAAFQLDPTTLIGVRCDHNALTNNTSYPDFVTDRTFNDALKGLIATGYVEHISLGTQASGISTRVRGTPKLRKCLQIGERGVPELEDHSDLIRLKLGKKGAKKRVRVDDDDHTMEWRRNLERINQLNANYSIHIDLSRSDWEHMEAIRRINSVEEATSKGKPFSYERVNFTNTRLYRTFNSPDWSHGGRFYGGWWQTIPGGFRKHITINDKPTCEYDFSAIHLRLLYGRVGVPVPHAHAPYDRPYGEGYREAVKAAFNVMLNAKKTPKPETVPEFSSAQMGITWRSFLQGICKHHSNIKHFFNTGIGTELQRIDSNIAEAVLLRFADMRQPCLPVHDSFITYATLADEVADIACGAALDVAGVVLPVKQSHLTEQTGSSGPVLGDISDILDRMIARPD